MEELKKQLRSREFKNLYLFYGNETFLIKYYENQIKTALIPEGLETMNLSAFSDKDCAVPEICEACETLPFMCEKRIVIVKNSGLFTSGRKNDSEKMLPYIANIPNSSLLMFIESDVDKRGKLYKALLLSGKAVEFGPQHESELIRWICNTLKKHGFAATVNTASHLVKTVGPEMSALSSEMEKLMAYKYETKEIIPEDIDAVCVRSLETRVFDLMAAIGKKDTQAALTLYSNMIFYRESPLMILVMITRQLRIILQCKYLLARNRSVTEIVSILGLQNFIVRDCANQSKNFTEKKLISMLVECLEVDNAIKTGKMPDKLALELMIAKFGI